MTRRRRVLGVSCMTVAFCLAAFVFLYRPPRITQENYHRLRGASAESEVEAMLGSATRAYREDGCLVKEWEEGSRTIMIKFDETGRPKAMSYARLHTLLDRVLSWFGW
jgi:hypothetical protein